ncbi:MAG: hypothetical protein GF344_01165 [Chitinivibrionales bacterium]|nr:hypothetical protein [Chitinivibrionales bacterium]MBD3355707.1 hypothetical protein [Chitinivibrionales bacterium]
MKLRRGKTIRIDAKHRAPSEGNDKAGELVRCSGREGRGRSERRPSVVTDTFHRFIEAEINEIMRSMDDESRLDPNLCSRAAMEWISRHAKAFREKWNKEHSL